MRRHGSLRPRSGGGRACAHGTRALLHGALLCTLAPGVAWAQTSTETAKSTAESPVQVSEQVPSLRRLELSFPLPELPGELAEPATPSSSIDPANPVPLDVEIVVQGKRPLLIHSSRSQTAASTVLTRERLDHVGDSAADVLRQVPGVQVHRTGAESERATINIRGAGGHQVPVYVAGVRINDEVSGFSDLSTVPLWMMQRVEVFRGNAPASADQLGLGGAVFFEPKRPERTRVGAQGHVGSYGARSGWLAAEVAAPNAASLVTLRRSRASNDYPFTDDQGQRFVLDETETRRPNADFASSDAWAVGRFRWGKTRIAGVLNALDREQGVTGVATTPAEHARAHTRRLLGGISLDTPCDDEGTCRWGVQSSALVENATVRDPYRELRAPQSRWLHTHGQRLTQGLSGQLPLSPRLHLQGSLRGVFDQLSLARAVGHSSNTRRDLLRAAAGAGYRPWDSLLLTASLAGNCLRSHGRFEHVGRLTSSDRTQCTFDQPDAQLGAAWTLSEDWTLLSNVAHGLRLPTLGELYGTSPVSLGEPELRPETSVNVDLGARGHWSTSSARLWLDAFVFQRWADDLIRFQQTSMFAFTPYNVGQARLRGAEGAAAVELWGALRSESAFTLLDARNTSTAPGERPGSNDTLPLLSRLVLSELLELGAELPAFNARWAAVGVRYFYRSNRFADPAGLVTLPEFQQWDVHARWHLLRPDVELTLAVNNLLDVRALDIIGLPLPARAAHVSVEAWW